ncbi:hypothetical protein JX265_007665 [Neoarthrinium moseri]|uniref:Uncharacterized protein n=1 Tax=Neoarthrinium moseri TaxID=1658444 RepID=A0A9Q0APG1_9PEZI|nr:hypothetical protein JX265_007665 [Neoarthrinium moseri]
MDDIPTMFSATKILGKSDRHLEKNQATTIPFGPKDVSDWGIGGHKSRHTAVSSPEDGTDPLTKSGTVGFYSGINMWGDDLWPEGQQAFGFVMHMTDMNIAQVVYRPVGNEPDYRAYQVDDTGDNIPGGSQTEYSTWTLGNDPLRLLSQNNNMTKLNPATDDWKKENRKVQPHAHPVVWNRDAFDATFRSEYAAALRKNEKLGSYEQQKVVIDHSTIVPFHLCLLPLRIP